MSISGWDSRLKSAVPTSAPAVAGPARAKEFLHLYGRRRSNDPHPISSSDVAVRLQFYAALFAALEVAAEPVLRDFYARERALLDKAIRPANGQAGTPKAARSNSLLLEVLSASFRDAEPKARSFLLFRVPQVLCARGCLLSDAAFGEVRERIILGLIVSATLF